MDEKKAEYLYNMIVNSKKDCDQIEHCNECPRYSQLMCLSHKIADDLAADPRIKVVVYEYADERISRMTIWVLQ